jgi:hypothetical protein
MLHISVRCAVMAVMLEQSQTECGYLGQGGREVEFTVRGPRFVTFDLEEDHRNRPGCSVLDVIFPSPTKVY